MADDIVTRLRHAAVGLPQDDMNQTAADEIERLRAERDDWQSEYLTAFLQLGFAVDEIANLRVAGDALVESLDHSRADIRSAVAAWEEARRG